MKLSICVPTYNRAEHLANCLNSIVLSGVREDVQVCVSDNGSTDHTAKVIENAKKHLNISYCKNSENIGIPRNFSNVISMAKGEFVWLLGDDDLLMPNAICEVCQLIDEHPCVDFFYINSCDLNSDYLNSFPHPFDTKNLPQYMNTFSKWNEEKEMPFFQLINPSVSFDFLGGMFLSVFRKKNWDEHVDCLDQKALFDFRVFSHFDNTFPHVKVFSEAFSESVAYFKKDPLSVCLSGVREWTAMYPLVHSVRLIEALEEYRKNGLSFWSYLYCKNYALNAFLPEIVWMFMHKKDSGYEYVKPLRLLIKNAVFPNLYMSPLYFIARKVGRLYRSVVNILIK